MLAEWLLFQNPKQFFIELVVILLSITLHEFGHALAADRLGDDTPRRQGRLSLRPDRHFDPLGLLMIFIVLNAGIGLGWGKPVQVDSRNFRNPRRDMLVVAICGPLMNLLLGVVGGLILRFALASRSEDWLATGGGRFLLTLVLVNVSLLFFNLIPLPPLDGSKILGALLPPHLAWRYTSAMSRYGMMILILIAFVAPQVIFWIVDPPTRWLIRTVVGLG
jgi:Zn-dependent protease